MSVENIQRILSRIEEIKSRFKQMNNAGFEAQLEEATRAQKTASNQITMSDLLSGTNKSSSASDRQSLETIARDFARLQGLSPDLVNAVIDEESGYDPDAVSPAGAQGLMQLMPSTAKMMGVTDPFDPLQNIAGGTGYLRQMVDRYGGDIKKALAAYNAGPEAVDRYNGIPPYSETQNYVLKILNRFGDSNRQDNLSMDGAKAHGRGAP